MAGRWFEGCRKIVCIGRNYAEHAKELGNAVPSQPFFFLKPPSALLESGGTVEIPPTSTSVHHEVELAAIIGRRLDRKLLHSSSSLQSNDQELLHYAVSGYSVALDLTARDLQNVAKEKRLPWTEAKGYDTFCPIGDRLHPSQVPDPLHTELTLRINGELRQKGNTSSMIFPLPAIIRHIAAIMTLEPNDIILTGTPPGVAEIRPGDALEIALTGITSASFRVQ